MSETQPLCKTIGPRPGSLIWYCKHCPQRATVVNHWPGAKYSETDTYCDQCADWSKADDLKSDYRPEIVGRYCPILRFPPGSEEAFVLFEAFCILAYLREDCAEAEQRRRVA